MTPRAAIRIGVPPCPRNILTRPFSGRRPSRAPASDVRRSTRSFRGTDAPDGVPITPEPPLEFPVDLPPGLSWAPWHELGSASRGPEPIPDWLVCAHAVDRQLGVIKTGKEAEAHLVERSSWGNGCHVPAGAQGLSSGAPSTAARPRGRRPRTPLLARPACPGEQVALRAVRARSDLAEQGVRHSSSSCGTPASRVRTRSGSWDPISEWSTSRRPTGPAAVRSSRRPPARTRRRGVGRRGRHECSATSTTSPPGSDAAARRWTPTTGSASASPRPSVPDDQP